MKAIKPFTSLISCDISSSDPLLCLFFTMSKTETRTWSLGNNLWKDETKVSLEEANIAVKVTWSCTPWKGDRIKTNNTRLRKLPEGDYVGNRVRAETIGFFPNKYR